MIHSGTWPHSIDLIFHSALSFILFILGMVPDIALSLQSFLTQSRIPTYRQNILTQYTIWIPPPFEIGEPWSFSIQVKSAPTSSGISYPSSFPQHRIDMSRLFLGGPAQPPIIFGVDPPSRLEISKFVNDEKQFSLYIQALRNYSP